MQQWPDGFVDLCYLDPPFNSKTNYNVLFGKQRNNIAQTLAFTDTWHWDNTAKDRVGRIEKAVGHPAHRSITGLRTILGDCGMMAYLSYMAERLVEIRRVLKPTGSMYLHCDPTASHYLKVVLDDIFDKENFRNEIVWCYTGPGSPNMRQFSRKHDIIFFYVKGEKWIFNTDDIRVPHKKLNTNRKGAAIADPLTPEIRDVYLAKGKVPETWWSTISPVGRLERERLGYPTQKPLALLKRIIKASSNEGDLVLDPFCGCGTTIAAADRWNRKWLGIDISALAIDLVQGERFPHQKLRVSGIPEDFKTAEIMVRNNPFDFEKWAITRIPGMLPNNKQRGDGGVDGRGMLYNWRTHKKDLKGTNGLVLSQVKGGSFHLGDLRDFLHTVEREKASFGVFITLNKVNSNNAKAEMQTAGDINIGVNTYKRVQLWSIEEYFDEKAKLPKLPPLADPVKGTVMNQSLFR